MSRDRSIPAVFKIEVMIMAFRSPHTKWLLVLAFLLPSLIGFIIFTVLPLFASLGLAFTDYSGGFNVAFVGLDNFYSLVTDADFYNALWVTVKFLLLTVIFQMILGFVFALMVNKPVFGRNLYRSVLYLPTILSSVAVSLVFVLMLHPQSGPVNNFLLSLGLPRQPWLTSSRTALGTIILVTLWQSVGYYMVLYLGGLQTINPELYEAAEIDGANAFRKLFHVTIPLLSPTTFYCFTIAIINGFKVFDQVFMMTGGMSQGGGPDGSTMVLVFKIYRDAFSNYKMGYASCESLVLLLIVLTVTIIQYRGQTKWVTYEG
jgi:multiple sugar transport system permease protein